MLLSTFSYMFGQKDSIKVMDIQGHRGWKGVYPENTLHGFLKALEIGVTTLEMDVVVSQDSQVIVSHEPWFNALFTTLPDGTPLIKDDEKSHNIFRLSYRDIQKYDVGVRTHPDYPFQKSVPAYKPSLHYVLSTLENQTGNKHFVYNIEIKRKRKHDYIFHPDHATFVRLVMETIELFHMSSRVIIQSFDHETLTYLHEHYPEYTTSLLTDDRKKIRQHIQKLGYIPEIISPRYNKINKAFIEQSHALNIRVIPWTVNDMEEASRLIRMGVDGIITDYPQICMKWLRKEGLVDEFRPLLFP